MHGHNKPFQFLSLSDMNLSVKLLSWVRMFKGLKLVIVYRVKDILRADFVEIAARGVGMFAEEMSVWV
jgi:hypothetical protein